MSTTVEQPHAPVRPRTGFLAVRREMLQRLRHPAADLFIQYKPNSEPVLYHRANAPFDSTQLSKLQQAAGETIYVRSEDFRRFGAHLLETVDAMAEHEEIPAAERFAVLQIAMAVEIEHAVMLIDCGQFVSLAKKLGSELTSLMSQSQVLPKDLFRLARHDFNTFTHVTNVASYAVVLAQQLGWREQDELERIAEAAILHDIGKRFIPASILMKPAKLNAHERAIIESHPQRGYEELCKRPGMTFGQLMIVYQHHERFDGQGYPVGLCGEEIHPWARMIAVVDLFDAVTGMRPYRRPASAREAMDYIQKNAGTHFDPEIAKCWKAAMANN